MCRGGDVSLSTLRFVVTRSDGVVVPLVPGGAQMEVTVETLDDFCTRMERYRRHEFDQQSSAMLRGMSKVRHRRWLCGFVCVCRVCI